MSANDGAVEALHVYGTRVPVEEPSTWSHGTGAEVMQRIAVPMIGGMVSSSSRSLLFQPFVAW
jgi:hypothetical protein